MEANVREVSERLVESLVPRLLAGSTELESREFVGACTMELAGASV